ncbi:unnamed protein product [Owenia fusiformis]|uniref:Uncharacterized protein n=1 Tax=Owenia fusiformis TaxID=6347 RepID=A0A8J1U6F3_OWEFU|nr:unnamed protein product [Owenia fusiformis]
MDNSTESNVEEKNQTGFVVVEHEECLRHIKDAVNDDIKKLEQRIVLLEKQLKLHKYSQILQERFVNVVMAFIMMISPVCLSFALDFSMRGGRGYYGREGQLLKENLIRLLLAFSCMVGLPVFVNAMLEWKEIPIDDSISATHDKDEADEIESEDDEVIEEEEENNSESEEKDENNNVKVEEKEE